mmetsp:Transcript_10848/g.11928  ORF Transcript_10848/g.11928 Transcript_10848/m.11928 type:complete len:238 (+) Transcript_10848:14-727(+)
MAAVKHSDKFIISLAGSFNPIHIGHVEALCKAKKAIEDVFGIGSVIQGYLAAAPDNYVSGKLEDEAMHSKHRLALIDIMTQRFEWIKPCAKTYFNAKSCLESNRKNIHGHHGNNLKMVVVTGGDRSNLSKAKKQRDMYHVMIARKGDTQRIQEEFSQFESSLGGRTMSKKEKNRIIFVQEEVSDVSSTKIRKILATVLLIQNEEKKKKKLGDLIAKGWLTSEAVDYIIHNEKSLYMK